MWCSPWGLIYLPTSQYRRKQENEKDKNCSLEFIWYTNFNKRYVSHKYDHGAFDNTAKFCYPTKTSTNINSPEPLSVNYFRAVPPSLFPSLVRLPQQIYSNSYYCRYCPEGCGNCSIIELTLGSWGFGSDWWWAARRWLLEWRTLKQSQSVVS